MTLIYTDEKQEFIADWRGYTQIKSNCQTLRECQGGKKPSTTKGHKGTELWLSTTLHLLRFLFSSVFQRFWFHSRVIFGKFGTAGNCL